MGDLRPRMVFLENVTDIVRLGLSTVVQTLCNEQGYELRWLVLGAGDLGAPHLRRRWFCLATLPDVDPQGELLGRRASAPMYPWVGTPAPAVMTLSVGSSRRVRCAALGNAVVPDCVRHAFWSLLSFREADSTPWRSHR